MHDVESINAAIARCVEAQTHKNPRWSMVSAHTTLYRHVIKLTEVHQKADNAIWNALSALEEGLKYPTPPNGNEESCRFYANIAAGMLRSLLVSVAPV